MGQFFTHTLTTVIANKYMNFMSIGFFVVELLVIDDEDRFRVFGDRYTQIQSVVNILGQFFAHTSATVAINKRVNCISISIRFLVVELLIIDDGDLTAFSTIVICKLKI